MPSREFYDDYVPRQIRVGVNARHRAIARAVRRAGWQPGHRVLEIGCGIGTLTQLLVDGAGQGGRIVGVDLSPRSIEVARERLGSSPQVELVAGDALEVDLPGPFDVVVLPDVIEHIPLEHHPELFRRLGTWLAPGGFVLLNYPSPHYLAWCREYQPDLLQAIDQPIHADALLNNAYASGLYLDRLETYSVWIEEGDYVSAVLRRQVDAQTFTPLPDRRSLLRRVRQKLRRPG